MFFFLFILILPCFLFHRKIVYEIAKGNSFIIQVNLLWSLECWLLSLDLLEESAIFDDEVPLDVDDDEDDDDDDDEEEEDDEEDDDEDMAALCCSVSSPSPIGSLVAVTLWSK